MATTKTEETKKAKVDKAPEKATEKAAKKAPEKAAAKAEKEPVMYVGPTIASAYAINNVVYAEIPAGLAELVKGEPVIGELLIPVGKYPEAEKAITKQAGIIWAAYKAALEHVNK